MKNTKTQAIVKIAMIAAIYTVLTLAIPVISYGQVQFRLSEVLTVLPAYAGIAVPGLTLGCVIANLVGFVIGANQIGIIDALFGSAATLIAGLITFVLGKRLKGKILRYILIPLPAVILNALIVGIELTVVFSGGMNFEIFLINAVWVGLGELVVCYVLGVPFMIILERNDFYKKLFHKNNI